MHRTWSHRLTGSTGRARSPPSSAQADPAREGVITEQAARSLQIRGLSIGMRDFAMTLTFISAMSGRRASEYAGSDPLDCCFRKPVVMSSTSMPSKGQ
jgi:hypothetical protein